MQTDILKDYISRDDLAEKLGKSVKTLVRWELDGKGPPVTRIGRDVFYRFRASNVVEGAGARGPGLDQRQRRIKRRERAATARSPFSFSDHDQAIRRPRKRPRKATDMHMELNETVVKPGRRRPVNRRNSIGFAFEFEGQAYRATASHFDDGALAEIFLDTSKAGKRSADQCADRGRSGFHGAPAWRRRRRHLAFGFRSDRGRAQIGEGDHEPQNPRRWPSRSRWQKAAKNRRRDTAIVVSLSAYEGTTSSTSANISSAADGCMRPTTKGIAMSVRRLPELSKAVRQALEKARRAQPLAGRGRAMKNPKPPRKIPKPKRISAELHQRLAHQQSKEVARRRDNYLRSLLGLATATGGPAPMYAPFIIDRNPEPIEIDPRPCLLCGLTIDRHDMVDDGEGPEFFCADLSPDEMTLPELERRAELRRQEELAAIMAAMPDCPPLVPRCGPEPYRPAAIHRRRLPPCRRGRRRRAVEGMARRSPERRAVFARSAGKSHTMTISRSDVAALRREFVPVLLPDDGQPPADDIPPVMSPEEFGLPAADAKPDPTPTQNQQPQEKPDILPFETFDASQWEGVPIEPRRWIVADQIPLGEPGIMSGDGGTGKTKLALQLAGAIAGWPAGLDWWVVDAEGPALVFSAEEKLRRCTAVRRLHPEHRGLSFRRPCTAGCISSATQDQAVLGRADAQRHCAADHVAIAP